MGTFKGAPKTKEQIKAQEADRARRKANQPAMTGVVMGVPPEEPEPEKEGFIAKVKRKRRKKKSKEQEVEQTDDQESGE